MISVSLPPKHNPAGRVGARGSTSCNSPWDLSSGSEPAAVQQQACLSALAAQGVYLGHLLAPRDKEIVQLTMLIQGARNFSPCLGFSCPRGRKSTRSLSAEDRPEALGSDIPALNSGSSSPANDSAVPVGPGTEPWCHQVSSQLYPCMPAKSLWLQRISALFIMGFAGPDPHMSGMYFQSWTFCELVIKAQLTVDSLVPVTQWH